MPELPEVESVRRLMERTLVGRVIQDALVIPDSIVLGGRPELDFVEALAGRRVIRAGRKGKIWWLELDRAPALMGHLGMSGWIRRLGPTSKRLVSHGRAPLDDVAGNPRFLKALLTVETGDRIAFTDGRRLGRIWLSESPLADRRVVALGPDSYNDLPSAEALFEVFRKRTAPIKATLLDQKLFAGIGNWVADEVLFHARIAPARDTNMLNQDEVKQLACAIKSVLRIAVEAEADDSKYPNDWLFHVRWGGSRGAEHLHGRTIKRDQIGGRTTAWIPGLQQ